MLVTSCKLCRNKLTALTLQIITSHSADLTSTPEEHINLLLTASEWRSK